MAVKSLTYPVDVLVVDNSPFSVRGYYIEGKGFKYIWDEKSAADQTHAMLRITQSMEIIRRYFLDGPWDRWFNLEADVIPPPNVIETMLEWGKNCDWISHSYPPRSGSGQQQGIGCSLLSRKLVQEFTFAALGDNPPDGGFWGQVLPRINEFPTMELWGVMDIKHLAEPKWQ